MKKISIASHSTFLLFLVSIHVIDQAGFRTEEKPVIWSLSRDDVEGLERAAKEGKTVKPGRSRGPGNGPIIEIIKPDQERLVQPFEVLIRFRPNKAEIDLASLRVIGRQKCFGLGWCGNLDFSDKAKPYAEPEGITIPKLTIPSLKINTKYRMDIYLKDRKGRESVAQVKFEFVDRGS